MCHDHCTIVQDLSNPFAADTNVATNNSGLLSVKPTMTKAISLVRTEFVYGSRKILADYNRTIYAWMMSLILNLRN